VSRITRSIESLLFWIKNVTMIGLDFGEDNAFGSKTGAISAAVSRTQVLVNFSQMILHFFMKFALVLAPTSFLVNALPLLSGNTILQQ
jgi:hypothetical protein